MIVEVYPETAGTAQNSLEPQDEVDNSKSVEEQPCYGPQAQYTFPASTYRMSLNPLHYIPVSYTYSCSPQLILLT